MGKRQRVIVLTCILLVMMLCSSNAFWKRRRRRRCNRVNCEVSSWSSWSSCSTQCGTAGRQTRSRRVTRQASCGGSCSYSLSGSRSCNVPGCNGHGSPLSRSCSCSSGWQGTCCQSDKNECQSSNGGCHHVCVNTWGSFRCQCRTGYRLSSNGRSCQDINECQSSNRCQHVCVNTVGSYTCRCNSGYQLIYGYACRDINECQNNNGGCQQTCINTGGSFRCSCSAGYRLQTDRRSCEDINECQSSNGGCQHTCENTMGSHVCHCNNGYQLLSNKRSCQDIDECSTGNGGCAHVCQNTAGSYLCSCHSGYKLAPDGKGCQDENECMTNNGGCAQDCQNTLGSYKCSCFPGYQLLTDTNECEDINECDTDNGGCQHICNNTQGGFSCLCEAGYIIDPEDGKSCQDIDECSDAHSCNQICTNTIGSYFCSCEDGYSFGDDLNFCEDINECNFGVCEQVCVNTQGSYLCACDSGYIMEGQNCSDINECLNSNGGCDHDCQNTVGSHNCSCRSGYVLGEDGKLCNDIDECSDGQSDCVQHCVNLPGTYECECLPGYQGDPLVDCQDVDECHNGTSACEQGCVNTPGSFQCSCQQGYKLDSDGRTCSDYDACEDGSHGCEHICQSLRGRARCSCNPGYSLTQDNRTCTDIDECTDGTNLCDQTCHNSIGSYLCSCNFGFILSQDGKTCQDVCTTHSCRHGNCVPSEDNNPECDCSDSGYEGQHCEMGVITVQEMPSLIAGETYPVTIEARPDSDLTVVPTSDHLEFIPPTLTFTSQATSVQTTVIPQKSGDLSALLQIFGSNADAFQPTRLDISVLSAFEKLNIPDFSLPKGCHSAFLFQCPDPSSLSLALSSTSEWYQRKGNSNVRYTLGVVFLDISGFQLPISLKGIQIIQTSLFSIQTLPATIGKREGRMADWDQGDETECPNVNITKYDVDDFIEKNSFQRTFFDRLDEKLPDWIKLNDRGGEYVSFRDISATIRQGKDLKRIGSCRGAPVYADDLYTAFQFKSNAMVSIFGDTVPLPEPLAGRKFCVLVDACNDFLGTVILMFPEDSRIDLSQLNFLSFLADYNWRMTLGGLGLSFSRKLSPIETNVELWNGDHMFSYTQPPGYNAWMEIYIAKDDDNDGAMGYSINGQLTLMLSVQDLNKALTHVYVTRWDAFLQLEAGLNFDFRLKIFGQQVGVYFEQLRAKAVGYLSLGGFGRQWCGASADPPGVFVNLVFARQPFGHSLFAKLFQPRTDLIVSAFLNYDVSDALRSTPSGDAVITPLLNALKPDIRQLADLITNFTTSTLTLIDEAISERLSDLETRVNELHDKIDNAILGLSTGTLKDIPDVVTPITTSVHDIQTNWSDLKAKIISQTRNLESDLTLYIDSYISRAKQSIDDLVKNFIDHMLRLENGLSGVGLRFASELNIFETKIGLVEVELVASSKLGQCSRFSDVYQHLGEETAVRGLVVLPVYYKYAGIMIKQVGHEFALSLERHDFIFRFLARIKVLGISSEPNLFINPKFIFFEAEGKIWGVSYASVNARASVTVPWHEQRWTVSGEFDLRSFPAAMNTEMTRTSEYVGQKANERLNMAKDIVEIANAKLDDAKSWLDKKKADVDKAKVLFDSAVNALSRVEDTLESMQEQVEEARDRLREKQRDVDNLCRIRTCKKLCIPGVKCRICSKKVLGVKVRYPCCGFTKCMMKVPNLVCIGKNVICAALRAAAFLALKLAEEVIGITMVAFDQTQLLVQGAQVVVDKSQVVLEAAKVGFDLAKGSFTAMQEASRGAQLAVETTTRLVAGGLEVFNFIVRHGRGAIVDVKRSWFELEVSTFDVFLFEVYMEVDFFRLGSRELSVMINFKNYPESISNAATAIIKNIANSLIPIRGRRAIEGGIDDTSNSYNESNFNNDTLHIRVPFNDVFEDGNKSTVVSEDKEMEFRIRMFGEKCTRFEELADYLMEAMTVLYDIAFDSNAGMGNATDSLNGIDDMIYNITHIEKNNTGINVTEAFLNYNLTEQDIALAVMDLNVTENLVVNESINALFTVKDITLDEITAASDYHIITPWKQVMMNYTTEVFADNECASFEDCLFYTFDEIYGLYENVDLPNTAAMRSLITDAKQQFFAVLRNDSLRIADAEAVAAGVLDLLQESRDMKIFCATPPSITLQPSNLTTVENNNITLFCKAAADPPASYTWYKDGHLISAPAVTGDLYLSSVSESSRGWYLCQAGNHVANMTSVEVYVDVHTAPVITNVSESKLVLEGEEPPVVLTCNSTGWPLPSTQWFFTSTMSTNTSLDVDDGSLVLVKPRVSQTGSYTCEASNIVGKDTSKDIKVTIVGTSAAVPELKVSFEFYDGVLYEDHKMNITRCYTITRGSTEFVNNLKETISSELQNILGIGVDRFLDWRVTNIAQGDGIHGEVGVSIIAANITNTSTADNSYERIDSFYRSGQEDLSLLGTILQEASFQERVLFGEDGCSASFKSGTMNLTAPSGRCPAGYRVHETKNFLCVCCGPGQYRPAAVSSSTCLPCPFGSYQPSMCSSSCIPFPCGLTSIPTGSDDVDKDTSPILKPSVINTAESQEPTYAGQVILATMEDHLWLLNMCQMFNMDVETVHRPELPPVIAAHKMTDFLLIRLILVQQQKEFTIV